MKNDFAAMLKYCAGLDAHNDRQWFREHHDEYVKAKADFEELVEQLKFAVAEAAPQLSDRLIFVRAKDMLYRIPLDARIPRAKPYEPSFRALIGPDKRSWKPDGYYLRIAPSSSLFGVGAWCENTADMNRVRDRILAEPERFAEIVEQGGLHIYGDSLKRMPAGYGEDVPLAQYIKLKSWMVDRSFADFELRSFDAFADAVKEQVRRFEPFRQFVYDALCQTSPMFGAEE